jgi:serine/threonine-protein kinase HipA
VIHTDVHICLPDGDTLLCGEMVTGDADYKGAIRWAFRYFADYLDHPSAFALDPNRLPLATDEFVTDRPSGIHAVFEDALPDDWGKRLLIRKGKLGRGEQTVARM